MIIKYSREHILAVENRLQEYEDVLKAQGFRRLGFCLVCDSVTQEGCGTCLFSGHPPTLEGCVGPLGKVGHHCNTKRQQRVQYTHLLKRLDEAGYEFK